MKRNYYRLKNKLYSLHLSTGVGDVVLGQQAITAE